MNFHGPSANRHALLTDLYELTTWSVSGHGFKPCRTSRIQSGFSRCRCPAALFISLSEGHRFSRAIPTRKIITTRL